MLEREETEGLRSLFQFWFLAHCSLLLSMKMTSQYWSNRRFLTRPKRDKAWFRLGEDGCFIRCDYSYKLLTPSNPYHLSSVYMSSMVEMLQDCAVGHITEASGNQ